MTRNVSAGLVIAAILLVAIVPFVAGTDLTVVAYILALLLLAIAGGCFAWFRR